MSIKNRLDQTGVEPDPRKALRPQQFVVTEIEDAVASGCRRLFILGPARSTRLASVRHALGTLNFKFAIIDLGSVRSRRDLDLACKRAAVGKDFVDAMLRLERQAKRQRLAIVFHDFDGCFGSPGEDSVVDLVWMEAKNNCRGCKVIFTARNSDFVERCFRQFPNCRGFVREIAFPQRGVQRRSTSVIANTGGVRKRSVLLFGTVVMADRWIEPALGASGTAQTHSYGSPRVKAERRQGDRSSNGAYTILVHARTPLLGFSC